MRDYEEKLLKGVRETIEKIDAEDGEDIMIAEILDISTTNRIIMGILSNIRTLLESVLLEKEDK